MKTSDVRLRILGVLRWAYLKEEREPIYKACKTFLSSTMNDCSGIGDDYARNWGAAHMAWAIALRMGYNEEIELKQPFTPGWINKILAE
jgi:hypothetical protein